MGHSQMIPSALGVTDLGEGDTHIMMDDDRRGKGDLVVLYYNDLIFKHNFFCQIFPLFH